MRRQHARVHHFPGWRPCHHALARERDTAKLVDDDGEWQRPDAALMTWRASQAEGGCAQRSAVLAAPAGASSLASWELCTGHRGRHARFRPDIPSAMKVRRGRQRREAAAGCEAMLVFSQVLMARCLPGACGEARRGEASNGRFFTIRTYAHADAVSVTVLAPSQVAGLRKNAGRTTHACIANQKPPP